MYFLCDEKPAWHRLIGCWQRACSVTARKPNPRLPVADAGSGDSDPREGGAVNWSAGSGHQLRSFALVLDTLVDLVPVDGHRLRRIDADPDLVALDAQD